MEKFDSEEDDRVESFEEETVASKLEETTKNIKNKNKNSPKEKENEEENKPCLNLDLIKAISSTITSILDDNTKLENYKSIVKTQSKMVFSANSIPKISIKDYLIRIQTYTEIEKSTLILSLVYIDRLCELTDLVLTYYNIHRILFAAVLMAIKYNEDVFYDNLYYAEIAGVKFKELKQIEFTFVQMTDFKLYISPEKFIQYQNYLENFEK